MLNQCCVVMPYYKANVLLNWQIQLWLSYSEDIRNALTFIIVDDGSPVGRAIDVLKENKEKILSAGLKIELYEVTIDKIWNSEGASNLGIQQVTTDRFLRMDFDYHFEEESMRKILETDLKQDEWYNFTVLRYGTREHILSHVNTYLMMKETFWKSGGYDEDFCGNYGWTDLLLERILAKFTQKIERDDVFLVTCSFDSTHGLERDGSVNKELLARKTEEYAYKTDFSKEIIRFPWRKVDLWQ